MQQRQQQHYQNITTQQMFPKSPDASRAASAGAAVNEPISPPVHLSEPLLVEQGNGNGNGITLAVFAQQLDNKVASEQGEQQEQSNTNTAINANATTTNSYNNNLDTETQLQMHQDPQQQQELEGNSNNGITGLGLSLMNSSPPPHSYRHSRAYRHFKNPPQPHMCIRTTTEAGEELFINVLSWTRIVIPQEPSDPIPLYGGMRVRFLRLSVLKHSNLCFLY